MAYAKAPSGDGEKSLEVGRAVLQKSLEFDHPIFHGRTLRGKV
jgi:hypothetical protein